jgi:hypothetical protein
VLDALATKIVRERRAIGQVYLYTDTCFDALPGRVNQFIRQLKQDFLKVYLTKLPGEAMTHRYDRADADSTLDNFTPKTCGDLCLHRSVWMLSVLP